MRAWPHKRPAVLALQKRRSVPRAIAVVAQHLQPRFLRALVMSPDAHDRRNTAELGELGAGELGRELDQADAGELEHVLEHASAPPPAGVLSWVVRL